MTSDMLTREWWDHVMRETIEELADELQIEPDPEKHAALDDSLNYRKAVYMSIEHLAAGAMKWDGVRNHSGADDDTPTGEVTGYDTAA